MSQAATHGRLQVIRSLLYNDILHINTPLSIVIILLEMTQMERINSEEECV